MTLISVILLAIFQGIAEFLPISSSGHLAVLGKWLGLDPEANFTLGIVLHAGTLLAILAFYCKSLLRFVKLQRNRLAGMVLLGSVPAGILGIFFKEKVEFLSANLWIVGTLFLVTAGILFLSEKLYKKRSDAGNPGYSSDDLTWKQALSIGAAQAVALLPGISRSGSTIAAGMAAGLNPAAAAEFSFLLAIPAIGGAALLEFLELARSGFADAGDPGLLVAGFTVAAVVGYISLALLLKILKKGKLALFSIYLCFAAAAVFLKQLCGAA